MNELRKYLIPGLLLCGLFAGCTSQPGSSEQSAEQNAENKKPKIALIMKSLANDFFSSMAKGAETHQQARSDEYDLVVNGIKDERDLSRQVALVEEMVSSGVDAIVIAPADSKALVPALRRAREAGVVVINIDNKLDAEILQAEKISIPFVGPDNQAGAKKVGDYLASQLKTGDEVIVLEGIRTSFNGTQRRLGFEAAMKAADIKIADSQSAQWEMSMANTLASSMLSEHPNAKAILAANDSMALGALAAVRNSGKAGEVLIVGFDNIPAVQQAIKEGQILATADQHGGELAVFGIEHALRLIANPNAKVEDRETPVDLVTAEVLK
ncbi:sugar ABC transporter substrate-binding protein [Gimesia algae]|uniref:D-allose-binding periplasmic protein n=1 Tax=Gimesia algae TaxID=2527971 RepID=A0A517V9J4_9PLAN|nr:sugar ABC transporter substrate-binding protein [Gimesia algae]QDT89656.1 D-allose-binding periplasmic protein precursor [Gimesia algae]